MNMNIGNLMRAMLNDGQPTDARALELRIGQIVRGVLLEVLDEGEALIQINGAQVRAKLDAELPVGRGTLLQVSQDSSAGAIVLKTLADLTAAPADEALKDVAKSFGLPDQKWSFELMRGLRRDGYPIDKETASWFKQAAAARPAGEDVQTWMNAAGVAFRRGLEATEATISSLKTALYGPQLSEQMNKLESLLADYVGKGTTQEGEPADAGLQAAKKLQQLLARGQELLSEGARQLAGGGGAEGAAPGRSASVQEGGGGRAAVPPMSGGREAAGQAMPGAAEGASAAAKGGDPELNAAGRSAGGTPSGSGGSGGGAAVGGVAGGADGARGALAAGDETRGGASARPADAGRSGEAVEAGARGAAGGEAARAGAAAQAADARGGSAADGAANARPAADGSWLGRFMELLGASHERQLAHQLLSGELVGRTAAETVGRAADDAPSTSMESLKSALLALAGGDDVPAALKEAAQGMAQQITGQQLLLSAERQNTAMMSHMTLFVPIKGQNGDTTATIQIQTRRGRKGEWDSGNCRLVFQLNMSHIGDTLVDVQIVDKVVSLRVLNDRPWALELLESARDEAARGMQEAGYQLLSLKTSAFPVAVPAEPESSDKEGASASSAWAAGILQEQAGSAYAAKPYKGVDYRA
ncbi:hypothetical protein [Cohnella fermenti]|uniref:Flagellar hook-length control protein FliK n=1 Tax=Cohnella fermenti TaxID=2565925 RepID=A0A4S4C0X3_9BACL|nr:hypothetical protein [Cohnella fermenti]THF81283.1 hypothetical protein E6C55_09235 [Cohnella fermenti]